MARGTRRFDLERDREQRRRGGRLGPGGRRHDGVRRRRNLVRAPAVLAVQARVLEPLRRRFPGFAPQAPQQAARRPRSSRTPPRTPRRTPSRVGGGDAGRPARAVQGPHRRLPEVGERGEGDQQRTGEAGGHQRAFYETPGRSVRRIVENRRIPAPARRYAARFPRTRPPCPPPTPPPPDPVAPDPAAPDPAVREQAVPAPAVPARSRGVRVDVRAVQDRRGAEQQPRRRAMVAGRMFAEELAAADLRGPHGAGAGGAVRLAGPHRQGARHAAGPAGGAGGGGSRDRGLRSPAVADADRRRGRHAGAGGRSPVPFDADADLRWHRRENLPAHPTACG